MTATMMTAAATNTRRLNSSPANIQPRNTATTGLTKAYVETRAGVLTFNSYT